MGVVILKGFFFFSVYFLYSNAWYGWKSFISRCLLCIVGQASADLAADHFFLAMDGRLALENMSVQPSCTLYSFLTMASFGKTSTFVYRSFSFAGAGWQFRDIELGLRGSG